MPKHYNIEISSIVSVNKSLFVFHPACSIQICYILSCNEGQYTSHSVRFASKHIKGDRH